MKVNKISGFSDEITSDVNEQFSVLNKLNIGYFEPRGIDGKNVSAKVAAITDIKPYDKYFSECSKMLFVSSNGYYITVFIINGEWGK